MKQSSNIAAATSPIISSSNYTIGPGTFTYSIGPVDTVTAVDVALPDDALTITSNDSDICIRFCERINGQKVIAELQPESDLRPIEQLRISSLITAGQECLPSFKPITLIRRYGIERHFRFSAA